MRRRLVGACVGVALGALALAGPAAAYDDDAFAFAATHMIEAGDVPEALGAYASLTEFFAAQPAGAGIGCFAKGDPVDYPSGRVSFSTTLLAKQPTTNSLIELAYQYRRAAVAQKAFARLTSALASCVGTTTAGGPNPDGSTWSVKTVTKTGSLPGVTVDGVESLFLNVATTSSATLPQGTSRRNDSYSVASLVGDAIIWTTFAADPTGQVGHRLRASVDEVARTAVDRWRG